MREVPVWFKIVVAVIGSIITATGGIYAVSELLFVSEAQATKDHRGLRDEFRDRLDIHKIQPGHPVNTNDIKSIKEDMSEFRTQQRVNSVNIIRIAETLRVRGIERVEEDR